MVRTERAFAVALVGVGVTLQGCGRSGGEYKIKKKDVYSNSKYLADFQNGMSLKSCKDHCSRWPDVCDDVCKNKKKCGLSEVADARHYTRNESCVMKCAGFTMHSDEHCTLFSTNVNLESGGHGTFYAAPGANFRGLLQFEVPDQKGNRHKVDEHDESNYHHSLDDSDNYARKPHLGSVPTHQPTFSEFHGYGGPYPYRHHGLVTPTPTVPPKLRPRGTRCQPWCATDDSSWKSKCTLTQSCNGCGHCDGERHGLKAPMVEFEELWREGKLFGDSCENNLAPLLADDAVATMNVALGSQPIEYVGCKGWCRWITFLENILPYKEHNMTKAFYSVGGGSMIEVRTYAPSKNQDTDVAFATSYEGKMTTLQYKYSAETQRLFQEPKKPETTDYMDALTLHTSMKRQGKFNAPLCKENAKMVGAEDISITTNGAIAEAHLKDKYVGLADFCEWTDRLEQFDFKDAVTTMHALGDGRIVQTTTWTPALLNGERSTQSSTDVNYVVVAQRKIKSIQHFWSHRSHESISGLFTANETEASGKCTDWDNDCCASEHLQEPRTCSGGYIPVEALSCKYTSYKACTAKACFGCFEAKSMTAAMEIHRLTSFGKHDSSKCSDWDNDCCASDIQNEPRICSDGYVTVPDPHCHYAEVPCTLHGCYTCYPPSPNVSDASTLV